MGQEEPHVEEISSEAEQMAAVLRELADRIERADDQADGEFVP